MKIWLFLVMMVLISTATGKGICQPSGSVDWKWGGKEMEYNSKNLFDYMDGAAELYLAYGFQHLTVRRFERPKQPPINVEVYEMASSEDAYGVFSFERQDETAGIVPGVGIRRWAAAILERKIFCQHLCRR